jgi:hypothetical protein
MAQMMCPKCGTWVEVAPKKWAKCPKCGRSVIFTERGYNKLTGAKTFAELEKKYPKPKLGPIEGGAFGDFMKMSAKQELGKEESGRVAKPSFFDKMKGGFGKAKTKYSEWSKKRSEATGKQESTPDQKEEAMERIREEHTGAKRIGFNTQNLGKKIGGVIASGVMVAVLYGASFIYRPDFAQTVLIIGGILIAFITISMFIKNAGGWLALGFLVVTGLVLFYTHTADTITSQMIAYAEPVLGPVYDQSMELIDNGVAFFQCTFGMTAGIDLQKCMESKRANATESVNKLGPVETLELNWGRNIEGKYDYDLPEQDSPNGYTLDITLVNKNQKIYKINTTDIKASTTSTVSGSTTPVLIPGSYYKQYEEYILEPREELPVRVKFNGAPSDSTIVGIGECKSYKNFDVNISTRQTSGGWSDFGFSPSATDEHQKFVHDFTPSISAEPGPLNIYVFTDPYVIVTDENNFKKDDQFEVVIKIQNTVKTGIAGISKIYLIQEFEIPQPLFDILENTCQITAGQYQDCECLPAIVGIPLVYACSPGCPVAGSCGVAAPSGGSLTPNVSICLGTGKKQPYILTPISASDKCQGSNNNCFALSFDPPLRLKPNKKVTISCNATVNRLADSEYTDQIRVYANFNYTQEWSKVIPCLT